MASTASVLYNFRLLAALRSDDPAQVQPFLEEASGAGTAQGGSLLGMAVKVGTIPVIQSILALPNIDINAPISEGTSATSLHVAAENGRVDAVLLLLGQPNINDTIRDERGRTALEAAATPEIASIIEDSRTRLQELYLHRLAAYIASPLSNPDEGNAMVTFLESPRAEILNLNTLDEKSGSSLLHEAARRRDVRLVEVSVKKGADVFLRDKRGKRVQEGEKSPDERIKAFLKQFSNQEGMVQPKGDGTPPSLKGYLSKWTNYKSGWRTRWFVLENGVLSYYRNREDEDVACRGSIAMAVAAITTHSDNARFELHSKASSSVPKIMVKSSHRGEIVRWVQAINLNIEYYTKTGRSASRTSPTRSGNADFRSSTINALPPTDNFLSAGLIRSTTGLSGASLAQVPQRRNSPPRIDTSGDQVSILEADDRSIITAADTSSGGIPHETVFDMGVNNIKAQVELTEQLVDSLYLGPSSPGGSVAMQRTPSRQQAIKEALKSSLSTLSILTTQQQVMTQDREKYLLGRIEREIEARKLWEENMLTVAKQQEEMDRQLTEASRQNERKKKALKQARGVLGELAAGSLPNTPGFDETLNAPDKALPVPPSASSTATGDSFSTARTRGQSMSISNIAEVNAALAEADSDDEDEDEFFDAIETGIIPNMKQYESIAHPDSARPGTPVAAGNVEKKLELPQSSDGTIKEYLGRKSLQPYYGVRNKLPIDDDKRPSVSLWGILKSSVGKDLTKISFPVSFNECTSMLQRMAEDMEYDACLTVAAGEEDSLRRIAFVAAFAMSNYSSTIGRIAKPFNPLLSQSFEYAIPNRYRYVSEQVSHHPPISACYSEAPTWKYYGEVDAQNRFAGKSFEIKPTGVAHADLIIPRKWVKSGLDYPDAGPEYEAGHVVEHYSWKKVTTNVSNFIMGSPMIDHYGDLVVTNHRTGETCTLTFKPRTWRGKDAFEIKGQVQDANGTTAWDIAGRWDTQLIARAANARSVPLDSDTKINPAQKEYLQLWRNSEKVLAPFNLTPFAVTLNDIPQGLKPYLCPTDCRLRTDQRAFENADYEKAQTLKTANEEKQRMTRTARAQGQLPPHEPRWFRSSVDPDSGERMWEPKRSEKGGEVLFWNEREKAPESWEGVDHIFVED